MHILRFLAPAALVALVSAELNNDDHLDLQAREEAPGYDDLGFFIRDVDHDDVLSLKTRDAEPQGSLNSDETDITLLAREADQFGDFDSLIALAEREAKSDDESAEKPAKKEKKKDQKKSKKRKSKSKKNKKGTKSKKGTKNKNTKNKSKKNKSTAQRKKEAKKDADLWA